MRIIELKSENVKKIKAIDITPKEDVVIINGKNGQGKTSILDSILYALAGANNIPIKPIREGETKATVTMNIGEYVVKRSFTQNNSYLEVKTKDGAKYPSPQAMLDQLIGELSFDPLEFVHMKSRDQKDLLMKVCGLDFDGLDAEYKRLYEERAAANSKVKTLEKQLAGVECFADVPKEPISSDKLIEELNIYNDRKSKIARLTEKIETNNNRRAQIAKELERLHKEDQTLCDSMASDIYERGELTKLTEPVNVNSIRADIVQANDVNIKIETNRRHAKLVSDLDGAKQEQIKCVVAIDDLQNEKVGYIKQAKMPIEGLSFSDDGVIFNGIPFEQVNDADKLKISIAMAMELNPKLRIIRITNGSLLDEDNLNVIRQMAKDKDFQIWIERVGDPKDVGIYVEEGEIRGGE